jgi:hypothetical protein
LVSTLSCEGYIEGGDWSPVSAAGQGGGAGISAVEPARCAVATPRRVRRLSLREYERAAAELVGAAAARFDWSSSDPRVHGFDNSADALAVSTGNFDDFAHAAEVLAESADLGALAPCGAEPSPVSCAREFARRFAARAYGRPPSAPELERLDALYVLGAEREDHARGLRLVIEAVLSSPYFAYRSELGVEPRTSEGDVRLAASELASALAFALTGARPDAELAQRAARPDFGSDGELRAEARRLLSKTDAREHFAWFLRGWLGVTDLRRVNKIPAYFPEFTPLLKADLDLEIRLFLEQALAAPRATLDVLFGESFSFVNASLLSTIYRYDYPTIELAPVPPPAGTFARVALDPSKRRGVLSLGGWLAAHSPVHRTSPVDRGLFVRSRLFCHSLPPPPAGAVFMASIEQDPNLTTRQKFERHSADPACNGCHSLIDPIGFGFETMDVLGRFRSNEAGLPLDASGVLTGTDVDGPFQGPAELSERLLASRQVRDCVVTQLFRFVEGREPVRADACELRALGDYFAEPSRTLSDLAVELVARPSFARRKAEP